MENQMQQLMPVGAAPPLAAGPPAPQAVTTIGQQVAQQITNISNHVTVNMFGQEDKRHIGRPR